MKTFRYEAMNQSGQEVKDTLEAASQEDALAKVRNMGFFPTRIREAGEVFEDGLGDEVRRQLKQKKWELFATSLSLVLYLVGAGFAFLRPFVYWWQNDHLTEMQVFKENWGGFVFGFICIMIAITKPGNRS